MNTGSELPTKEYLEECFNYDEDTGILYWKVRPLSHFKSERSRDCFNSKFSFREAGTKGKYIKISITDLSSNRNGYQSHRLIWKLVTGEDPVGYEIDHIDNDKYNNRFCNLRKATFNQNQHNRLTYQNSHTGVKGIGLFKRNGKYRVRIAVNNKTHYLGHYNTIEEAKAVHNKFLKELHGDFSNEG